MSTPIKLEVHVVSESGRRAGIGDVCVTIANAPVSVVLMLPAQDAEALALQVMAAVDEARGRPLFREEVTRKQCRGCLKDCAECRCAVTRNQKGA